MVYQMQWTNPRPDEEIKSIDIRYDPKVGNQYGVPALLAITAGTATKTPTPDSGVPSRPGLYLGSPSGLRAPTLSCLGARLRAIVIKPRAKVLLSPGCA